MSSNTPSLFHLHDSSIIGWPEELGWMLQVFKPADMPHVYFEYLLAKDAMLAMGWTWMRTDPNEFFFIEEMYIQDGVFCINEFWRNDA